MSCIYRADRIVTTAGIAINDDGRFFLAKRQSGGAQSERWEFPGGKCDEGDSDERLCLAREFDEELGVAITVHQEIGTIPFEHGTVRYVLVGYAITMKDTPSRMAVHTEAGWFTRREMHALELAESDRRLVERYFPLL